MADDEEVRVWDAQNNEITGTVEPWDTWDKVKKNKGFPGGLIAFLQTQTDHEGCGFIQPTIVQAYSWPVLQNGKDLVGVAKTGSGKTIAFLLPGFVKLRKLKKSKEVDTGRGPALLCVTPTRELCHQIYSDAEKFGAPVQITAACCYGGEGNAKDQLWAIQQGPDCLIATPGRLNNFIQKNQVVVDQVRYVVLDEADRMLDMGFEPQIKQTLEAVPWDERQTCMFTATWPAECKKLAETYIKDPMQIQIGSGDITTNKNIAQHVKLVEETEKLDALKEILRALPDEGNCLVFCNSKKKCGQVSWDLDQDQDLGMPATELHGDLDQRGRDNALWKFRNGDVRVMVATDLASRGLDVRNIAVVVNYDAPKSAEDYVHRIGRTGRAEDSGEAYTLLLKWGQEAEAKYIMQIMQKADQQAPAEVEELANNAKDDSEWKKDDDNSKKDSWDDKKDDWNADKKDEWNSEKKEDWKASSWDDKKDDWKKDDNKDDWWKNKEKEEKKDEWWKSDGKDEWWKKDEKENKDDWWKKEEEKKDDWWNKKDESSSSWTRKAEESTEEPPAKAQKVAGKSTEEIRDALVAGKGTGLKVADLKAFLEEHGLGTDGSKVDLIKRATEAVAE